ncbi:MAG: fumarylacetoacetate hydrolase family protein [Gammaproteobacteria bacterium]|nr:fumarylacetoacetate hydrolase family protein [Gammaproteobacteria bacterium]MYF39009.1 fumarylacetoacetate hydrolase family protein [Gammaproteobacteria bacterium]
MRWLSFSADGRSSFGYLEEDYVVDLGAVCNLPDLKSALSLKCLAFLSQVLCDRAPRISLQDIEFLPPIPNPSKVLCVGLNYLEHQKETGHGGEDYPTIFVRFGEAQIGHNGEMLRPQESASLDFEGEIAMVIGSRGRRIPKDECLDHIFGFSCYNDGSVRDYQRHTSQFTPGKNFAQTGGFGPWIMTTEEISDLANMELSTHLNGELMQHARSSDMVFDFATILSYCSTFIELEPGDVIVTGTPGGVGSRRDPPVFLNDGDVISVSVRPIGTLTNTVSLG